MNSIRILIGLLLIAAGPVVTVFLFVMGKGGSMDGAGIFPLIVSVFLMSAVTAAVSTTAHLALEDPVLATVVSASISEILYILLLLAYVFCMSEGRGRAESFMWLPVMTGFLLLFGFPTALSVSCGTGMIARDLSRK
jgi:hypothetical protein